MANNRIPNWDQRIDTIRLLKTVGFTNEGISKLTGKNMPGSRMMDWLERYPSPPSLQERVENQLQTPQEIRLGTNLRVLSLRIQNIPIPPNLRTWENLNLTNPTRVQRARRAASEAGHDFLNPLVADYYAVMELAPFLLPPPPPPIGPETKIPATTPYNRRTHKRHRPADREWKPPRKGERWHGERDGKPRPKRHPTGNRRVGVAAPKGKRQAYDEARQAENRPPGDSD